jgi:membrane protein DedA with SNARE-associated domain
VTVFQALLPYFAEYGYFAVFTVLMICGFGVPVPEDIVLVTGGVIAGLGLANEHVMVFVGLAGVLGGDGVTFALGWIYGDRITRLPILARVLTPARIAQAKDKLATHGAGVMFVARFLPGLRTPIFFTSGMTHRVSIAKWILMDGVAALLSVPIWVYLGYFGAKNFEQLFAMVRRGQHIIIGIVLLGALIVGSLWYLRRRTERTSRN